MGKSRGAGEIFTDGGCSSQHQVHLAQRTALFVTAICHPFPCHPRLHWSSGTPSQDAPLPTRLHLAGVPVGGSWSCTLLLLPVQSLGHVLCSFLRSPGIKFPGLASGLKSGRACRTTCVLSPCTRVDGASEGLPTGLTEVPSPAYRLEVEEGSRAAGQVCAAPSSGSASCRATFYPGAPRLSPQPHPSDVFIRKSFQSSPWIPEE